MFYNFDSLMYYHLLLFYTKCMIAALHFFSTFKNKKHYLLFLQMFYNFDSRMYCHLHAFYTKSMIAVLHFSQPLKTQNC